MIQMKHGYAKIVGLFVGVTVAIVLVGNVVMPTLFGVNTTTWDTATIAIWAVVGIVVVTALITMIVG